MRLRTVLIILFVSFLYMGLGIFLHNKEIIIHPALWALYGWVFSCINSVLCSFSESLV